MTFSSRNQRSLNLVGKRKSASQKVKEIKRLRNGLVRSWRRDFRWGWRGRWISFRIVARRCLILRRRAIGFWFGRRVDNSREYWQAFIIIANCWLIMNQSDLNVSKSSNSWFFNAKRFNILRSPSYFSWWITNMKS